MTSCEELLDMLKEPGKEKTRIEWKRSEKLRSREGQRDLGYGIVALANRHGGKLVIGVDDNGNLEGKGIFDIDKDRGIIDNICHMSISPVIGYEIEFLECDKGDVMVVDVPKREGIPHAYIVSREGPEIKNRIYYIRTTHGRRLVSDRQLQWLFDYREDPGFTFPFRIVINYLKDSLGIPALIQQPFCVSNYIDFVNSLSEEDRERLTRDWGTTQSFFIEITPYALINHFSWLFRHSWLIEIQRREGKTSSHPADSGIDSKELSLDDFPEPPQDSVCATLTMEPKEMLKSGLSSGFCVPPNTSLHLQYGDEPSKVELSLKHDDFLFGFAFAFSSMSSGLHYTHPTRAMMMDRDAIKGQERMNKEFQNIEMECEFRASFSFPEKDVELFDEYYRFGKTIEDLLRNDWDYDVFKNRLPDAKLYTIDNKLDKVLDMLEEKL